MPTEPSRIHFKDISPEVSQSRPATPPATRLDVNGSAGSILDAIGRDLTELARQGRLAERHGRTKELGKLQRILLRKEKNNPLLAGAPGVGKTALVEALACAIIKGEVPDELKDLRVIEISAASLVAGTAVRGTFEVRLQQLVNEVTRNPNVILFIDEIHSLIRAGAVEGGSLDAANILKPALARGEIHCIGATTLNEFDKFIHSDPAFERRFELLTLDEPSPGESIEILTATKPTYEAHHGLLIDQSAIEAAVTLSIKHILDRSLPDKAFDLLDNACTLARWPQYETNLAASTDRFVTADTVEMALSDKLGIPIEKLSEDMRDRLVDLKSVLNRQVVGQAFALAEIAAAMRKAYTGLGSQIRPKHVFAFFGSSGVGKTATAKALAEFLFDSPDALIRLDMSEFKEPHTISRLWGAPPGYVGYGDEGTFAGRLRRQPYSLVLLDEIEKAHPEINDAFLQIFDEGRFTDARGRVVDARQAVFIATSNLFTVNEITSADDHFRQAEAVRQRLSVFFRPEFINRLDDIILFGPLSPAQLAQIAEQEIHRLNERLAPYHVTVTANQEALDWLAERAYDLDSGARAVLRLVEKVIAEPVALTLNLGKDTKKKVVEVYVSGINLTLRGL